MRRAKLSYKEVKGIKDLFLDHGYGPKEIAKSMSIAESTISRYLKPVRAEIKRREARELSEKVSLSRVDWKETTESVVFKNKNVIDWKAKYLQAVAKLAEAGLV